KGLHLYVPVTGQSFDETKRFARAAARELQMRDPDRITDVMSKRHRTGKVFIDWSQNDAGKSTIAPYSLRGLAYPTVSMPVTRDEIEYAVQAGDVRSLVFLSEDGRSSPERPGDLLAPPHPAPT